MGMFSSLFGGAGQAKRVAGVAAAAQKAAGEAVDKRYQDISKTYQPYMDAGTGALSSYQNIANGIQGQVNPILTNMGNTVSSMNPIVGKLTSDNLNDYQKSPGYDFRMSQGEKAIQNSAAAAHMLNSGKTLKALEQYGQDYGTNDYQTYLGNLQNQLMAVNTQLGAQGNYLNSTINGANASLNAYSPLINTGANMTSNLGSLGMDAAKTQGAYTAGAGATEASGMQAAANSLASAGANWINLGSAAAGMAMGAPPGMTPQVNPGNGNASIQPIQMLPNSGNLSYNQPTRDNFAPNTSTQIPIEGMPWLNGTSAQYQPGQTPVQGMPWLNRNSGSLSNGALF
jgi:hypothetical protein